MEERLNRIFQNVNEWLKFAEAKNGALIAFNGAAVFGIFQMISSNYINIPILNFLLWISLIILSISLVISLGSFLPKTFLNTKSLLFFGHISSHSPNDYLNELSKSVTPNNDNKCSAIELDYANQIIVNSKISMRKYNFFKIGLFLTLVGISVITLSLLGYLIFYSQKGFAISCGTIKSGIEILDTLI